MSGVLTCRAGTVAFPFCKNISRERAAILKVASSGCGDVFSSGLMDGDEQMSESFPDSVDASPETPHEFLKIKKRMDSCGVSLDDLIQLSQGGIGGVKELWSYDICLARFLFRRSFRV